MRRLALDYRPVLATRLGGLKERPWLRHLDSCTERAHGGRYDLIAGDSVATILTRGATTARTTAAGRRCSRAGPFEILPTARHERLPPTGEAGPCCGGARAYCAYDLGRRSKNPPGRAAHDMARPAMVGGLYGEASVVDHAEQRAERRTHPAAHCPIARVQKAWDTQLPPSPAAGGSAFAATSGVQPDLAFAACAAAWRRSKGYRAGEVSQVNLTQRFSARARGDPWAACRCLRTLNPAPSSASRSLPGAQILSSSPERLLEVAHGRLAAKPIKGGRPRGLTPTEDQRRAAEPAASAKDRAAKGLIVDLLGRDWGRQGSPGSVAVPVLCAAAGWARVHHRGSTVQARLGPPVRPWRCCAIASPLAPSRARLNCGPWP